MFGNYNALDSVFEVTRMIREQTEKKFSNIPNKNLVQIVQNYDTTPLYRHLTMSIKRISSKITCGKKYGTSEQLFDNPETYIPSEMDKDVILNILYKRFENT